MPKRDVMNYDVVVVGAGPAGLSAALRLKQLDPQRSVCVVEKAAQIGSHSLSGAVMDPRPLDTLLPDWRAAPPPMCIPVTRDDFRYLSATRSVKLPVPPPQRNHGNFLISSTQFMPWLAAHCEAAGVDVFAGFPASTPLYDQRGHVCGVQLGDMGVASDGSPGPSYSPGAQLCAPMTLIAEGCRGSLAKQLIHRFCLNAGRSPATYGLGFKELWQVPAGRTRPGHVQHTVGWPLRSRTYGGGFIYHLDETRVYVGLIVGLDYDDPRLEPFEAFQRYKHHPMIATLLQGGEPLGYGARAIAAGGPQALPKLEMPGALLIGDAAGTLNVARLKGIHQAIRSGVLAADHLQAHPDGAGYDHAWRVSPGGTELQRQRNVKPGFRAGLWLGLANGAFETLIGGRSPWTLSNHDNARSLRRLAQFVDAVPALNVPVGLGPRTLLPPDRTAAVYLATTLHDESQPVHLKVADTSLCIERCTKEYGNPCTRFCPAGVYEIVADAKGTHRLWINAANCVHCKACDIKDPYAQITWTVPEGGSGPNYQNM